MFQFRAFPSYAYLIQRTILEYCSSGFPHSEISGSTDICSSPKLIAACHVLRRLLMPRHSPCALYSLTLRDILVLFLELCRQSTGYFRKIIIVTHIFSDVPQLKFTTLFNFRWNLLLPCFHHISIHCSVFKVQLLFQSNCCFASQNCNLSSEYSSSSTERRIICRASRAIESFSRFEARSQNLISQILRSNSKLDLVGPSGLEPPTLRLSVVRSSQLSYGPITTRACAL